MTTLLSYDCSSMYRKDIRELINHLETEYVMMIPFQMEITVRPGESALSTRELALRYFGPDALEGAKMSRASSKKRLVTFRGFEEESDFYGRRASKDELSVTLIMKADVRDPEKYTPEERDYMLWKYSHD